MMKKKNELEKQIIDEYYDATSNMHLNSGDEFSESMNKVLDKMNVVEGLDFPLEINILEIISKGEEIRDKRKTKYELAGFAGACLVIILVFTTLLTTGDRNIYLYIYAAISALLPLIIIPIAAYTKGEV